MNGTDVATFADMAAAVRKLSGPVPIVYERDGERIATVVDVTQTQRFADKDADKTIAVGAIGVSAALPPGPPTRYNPLTAVPATFSFTGDLVVELGKSLAKIPTKVGALVHAIGGGERDPPRPPRSVWWAPASSAATPSTTACGWRSGSSWPR